MMDQIKIVKNFIEKNEIRSMIEYIDHLEAKNLKEFGIYQEGKRLALQFGDDLYHKTLSHLTLDLLFEKENEIKNYFYKVLSETKKLFSYPEDLYVCAFWFAKQYPGAKVPAHEDTDNGVNLHFRYSAILYLNELESGGELSFLDLGYSYKPQAGDLVIFPTFGTGIHAVLEIPETRYSMPFWMTDDKNFDLLK
jgi:2OG-Fe(II) oxygenase superfamily